ncbi:MAG: hypothetical protein AAGJ28_00545 [Pseudomonadota bacterium]
MQDLKVRLCSALDSATKRVGKDEIELKLDYYWSVSETDVFTIDNVKPEVGIDSLYSDLEEVFRDEIDEDDLYLTLREHSRIIYYIFRAIMNPKNSL